MAKSSGLGDRLLVAGYDFSGDIGSLSKIGGGPAAIDNTGIDKSAMERIGGLRDGGIDFDAYFNTTAGQAHPRLSPLVTTDQIVSYCRGTTLGNPAASCVAKQVNYDGKRGTDGSYTFAISTVANGYGVEWGVQLTPFVTTHTGAASGSSVDLGSASPGVFGLQAYLQVTAFTGTDATLKIQESSDNGVGDAWADVVGGGFTQITVGPTTQRIATAAINVERYLRITSVTTGGFSSLSFAVMVTRNATSVVF